MSTVRPIDAGELESVLQAETFLVDTRDAASFGQAHIHGTINIPYNKLFAQWAGALIPHDRDLAFIIDDRIDPGDVARDLTALGFDRLLGYFGAAVVSTVTPEQTQSVTTPEMVELLKRGDVVIVDIREDHERLAGHIPGTIHIPLGQLAERAHGLPPDVP